MKNKWSEFKLRVNINAPVARAYEAWTTADGLTSWFLRKAIFNDGARKNTEPIAAGDSYEWYWHGYPDSVLEKGKILEANGTDRLSFTFSLGCPVNISIYSQHGETIVELVETDLPTDDETMLKHYVGDSKGWIFYLTNLKSVRKGGGVQQAKGCNQHE